MYIYAADLVRKLKQVWKKTRLYVHEEAVPPLPPDPVLRRLLDVAYHASLLTEEQRRPSFRVVCCSQQEFGGSPPGPSPRVRSCVKIDFLSPVPFNEKQLLQLAPATDPTSVLIAVEPVIPPAGSAAPEAELRIWGLLETGTSWWEHIRRESERPVHSPPDLLTITSTRPGKLTISRAWRVLMTLENGQLALPSADLFASGPIAGQLEEPINKLHERVYAGFQSDDQYEPLLNRHNCSMKYVACIRRMLTHLQEKPHGGTLILLPDDADGRQGFDELASVKYPCRHYELWSDLRGLLETKRRWFDLGVAITRGGDTCQKKQVVELNHLRSAMDEQEHALADGLQVLASLSGVDGAVLVTDRLRLVGFGAELRSATHLTLVHRASDNLGEEREPLSPDAFGTRHRSAFRFCADLPGAVAFVHSQDGGLRAIKNVGGEVIYWDMSPMNG